MRAFCVGATAVLLAMAFGGCVPDFAKQNDANVILRVNQVEATAGGEGQGGAFLLSDVHDTKGGSFNDNVSVTIENISKNPNTAELGRFNDVVLERFEVRYVRSDGRSTEGVDVPHRITGNVTALVRAGGTATVAFIVVRHQAKAEPPLVLISGGAGGAQLLTAFAEFTIYGRTTSGKAVQTSGSLQITFGDFVKATT